MIRAMLPILALLLILIPEPAVTQGVPKVYCGVPYAQPKNDRQTLDV